jgi:hypothetical protein
MESKRTYYRLSTVILATVFIFGCATTYTEQRTQSVRVTTYPSRAWVWQKDKNGKRTIGQSPVVVKTRYQVEKRKLSPWWWAVVGSTAVVSSVGAGLYKYENTAGQYVMYGGLAALALSLSAYYFLEKYYSSETPVEPEPVILGASLDGYLEQQITISVPGQDKSARLTLPPDPEKPRVAKPTRPAPVRISPAKSSEHVIVAVFDVIDGSHKTRKETLAQLTEYLAARLTQVTRYRVVPRDQLRSRLVQEKKGSFRKCYDESCQIELGKAVAAQKSLATKILRVGKRCAITSTMFDLKTETAEKSALAKTDCSVDGLMDTMDRIARQLSGGDYR